MDNFDFSGPRYLECPAGPTLILDGVHCWDTEHEGGCWVMQCDIASLSFFRHYLERGHSEDMSRAEFIRRFLKAAARLDNLEPMPGETREKFEAVMKSSTKGRWPQIRKDYWGVPELARGAPKLPDYNEVPIPGPLRFGPGNQHNYVAPARMMAESNAATRRLKGLRIGAWVMSPETSYRWANWRYGGVYWVPKQITLPPELEVKMETVND